MARRVDGLERKADGRGCPSCVDAPDMHLTKDERDPIPERCVRCGREIRCMTIIGVDLEKFGAPPETIAEMRNRAANFRRRQGLA